MPVKLTRLLSSLFSIKPNEWDGVVYFFLVFLVFSFGASFARSIGMALLIQNLPGQLPLMFILIDLSVMVGSITYAKYTKKISGLYILKFFFVAMAIFAFIIQCLLIIVLNWLPSFTWIYGLFFVGFFFFYVLIFIHIGSVVASYFNAVQVKRVTTVINAGIPIGGTLGGLVLVTCLNIFHLPPNYLILVLGLSCLGVIGLLKIISTRLSPVRSSVSETRGNNKTPFRELVSAFKYIINSRLMIFMSLGLIFFVIANKLLEYQYQVIIYPSIYPDTTSRASFFAFYEIFANLTWLFIQLFVTSRLIVGLGVGVTNLIYPVLAATVSVGLLMYFYWNPYTPNAVDNNLFLMLLLAVTTQFVNQEMRGALRTPANNLLFNAIPPNQWGVNKAFLNGIIFPFSTTIAGGFLIFMTGDSHFLSITQLSYVLPAIALIASVLGIFIAFPQWSAYNDGVFGLLNRELFDRNIEIGSGKNSDLRSVIDEKLNSHDSHHVIAALEMIRLLQLSQFSNQVGNLMLKVQRMEIEETKPLELEAKHFEIDSKRLKNEAKHLPAGSTERIEIEEQVTISRNKLNQTRNLLASIKSSHFDIKKHCLDTLAVLPQSHTNASYFAEMLHVETDPVILAIALKHLSLFNNVNLNAQVEKFLSHSTSQVFIEAALCLHKHPDYRGKKGVADKILHRLQENRNSSELPLYLYALGELKQQQYIFYLLPYLDSNPRPDVQLAALMAYMRMLEGQLDPYKDRLITALSSEDNRMRITALQALKECQPLTDWTTVIELLGAKDHAVVNESKELLRLSLGVCRNALVKQLFTEDISVQQRFEILSLVYSRLNELQKERLRQMADKALQTFICLNCLIRLHRQAEKNGKAHDLITKLLEEMAENQILHILTVITYETEGNLEFFQRVTRGLLSGSRANQGNALEVLLNAGEKFLTERIVKYFDERFTDIQAYHRVHLLLYGEPLEITVDNYEIHMFALKNDLLKACLFYNYKDQAKMPRLVLTKKSRELLIDKPRKAVAA
ncbi:MFS transporter [Beggiatoa leptomitoformis]|uniref:Uncharacterized protein n=1 Tax=Beggiatoa leptomitoformis TaxID=288004 RepID=A0A2N9YAI9_9GAMM|nr:MFS transporter [Beggiatoa leptomitoformis]ALG67127.1 hypothetical protein AL038_04640 [Beggiatoa leptomitoformis]AUI67475.1 hypothetical protein BLE401_01365 [Beggiatoa leptomitoformis]